MSPGVAGVLLAAGQGRRMGRPKALVELGGQLLVERALATLAAGGCQPLVVVLGAAAGAVREAADLEGAVVVVNDSWPQGMGSSLRAGLEAAEALGADAALILLVDQPLVTPALVGRLVDAWGPGRPAVRAAFGGVGRNPVVLGRALWPAVRASARADVGAREFLAAHPEVVTLVDCDGLGEPLDVDTPADLAALTEGTGGRVPRTGDG